MNAPRERDIRLRIWPLPIVRLEYHPDGSYTVLPRLLTPWLLLAVLVYYAATCATLYYLCKWAAIESQALRWWTL